MILKIRAPQEGPKKGAARNLSKSVKNFLTFFDDFWRFLPCAKIVEKLFDTFRQISRGFWRGPFPPAPFAIRWEKDGAGCPARVTDSLNFFLSLAWVRSRPGKPNHKKGQNEKFMNFAHFCEFLRFSLGKQARFTLNFCCGMPLRKVHELAFLWFGLPGPLLIGRSAGVCATNNGDVDKSPEKDLTPS